MSDPVEIRRRIMHMVERAARRDTYGTLLTAGQVVVSLAKVEDPDAWRAEIRRQARADHIKVRTGEGNGVVWALLPEAGAEARTAETRRYMALLRVVVPQAVALGHEPVLVFRDGEETLLGCNRCEVLGYASASEPENVVGGELFESECPYDTPPQQTDLTDFY